MAILDKQTSDLITEISTEGAALQATLVRLWSLVARFNENGTYGKLATAQDVADTGFPWLNQSKIGNAVAAFKSVQAALGSGDATTPVRTNSGGSGEAYLLALKG